MTDATLIALAEQLGVAVEVLWEALLRQATINAAEHLVWTVVFGILTTWAWGLKLADDWYENPSRSDLVAMASRIAWSMFFGIFLLFLGRDFVTPMINPEHWALKEILP